VEGRPAAVEVYEGNVGDPAALDGFYVVRSSLPQRTLEPAQLVGAYKGLAKAERAFRRFKTVDLHVRSDVPPPARPRWRPCAAVHVGLLRGVAYTPCVGADPFEKITRPTPLQQRALSLLGVRL